MPKPEPESEAGSLSLAELKRCSEVLRGMGHGMELLAKTLEKGKQSSIPCRGVSTSIRGMNYLANFVQNVLEGYNEARIADDLPEAPIEAVAKFASTRALVKAIVRNEGRDKNRD